MKLNIKQLRKIINESIQVKPFGKSEHEMIDEIEDVPTSTTADDIVDDIQSLTSIWAEDLKHYPHDFKSASIPASLTLEKTWDNMVIHASDELNERIYHLIKNVEKQLFIEWNKELELIKDKESENRF